MADKGAICILCFKILSYIFALIFGFLALLLPNWINTKVERSRTVTVVKEISTGLFGERYTYSLKEETIPDDPDNPFPKISETYVYPETVAIVKTFMIVGLSVLCISLVFRWIYLCCYQQNSTSGKSTALVYWFLFLLTFFSGVFVVSCPLIYHVHVIADFGPEKVSFGASWYFAFTSAGFTFVVEILTAFQSCRLFCKVVSKNSGESVSDSHSKNNRQKIVYTI